MKSEDEAHIEHLHSQNQIFISIDKLTTLSQGILSNNPNEKWLEIAKDLNGININLSQVKSFYNRVYEEMVLQAELNFIVKQYGYKEVLKSYHNYKKIEKENESLKKQIELNLSEKQTI